MKFKVTDKVRQKLRLEHNLEVYEVEEVFEDEGRVRFLIRKSKKLRETRYKFIGRTFSGRLLQVYIIIKPEDTYLMSAYDGDKGDRKLYNRG